VKIIIRLGLTLMVVSLVAALALGLTFALTNEQIKRQAKEKEAEAFRKVLPQVKRAEDFKEKKDLTKKIQKKYEEVNKVAEGYVSGKKVGTVVVVWPRGYGGYIKMAVGLDTDGKVTDYALIEHNETPGLGTFIEESSFRKKFKGKEARDPVEIARDIDAITGATVSSRAVTKGVRISLDAYSKIRE